MKKNFTRFLLALLATGGFLHLSAQNEFYNDGADVYVQAAGLIYVQGDIINDDQAGNVGRMHNSGDIQLTGNWSNTSAVSNVFDLFATGTTTFLGTGAVQTIGGTRETGFNNLTISKSGGTTQEVRQLINSGNDGILNLTNDFLNTQTFIFGVGNINPSAIQRTGAIVPNYLSSMTQGYVTSTPGSAGRLVRATNGTLFPGVAYLFPTGNGARFRPVEVTPAAGTGLNAYMVQFVNLPTPNTNLKSTTLSTVNPAWYHFIERQNVATNAENVRIYHDFVADNVCDINRVTMSEWSGALWFDLSPTTSLNPPGFLSWTQKNPYPGAYPTPWSPFPPTPFALAGLFILPNLSSCVFPVEYLSLTARPLETTIMLDWETATEVNNAGFEVYRSTDALNFENVGWVAGVGNSSSPTSYAFEDVNVVANQRYFYRLRQVDFNGGEAISNTVEAILLKGQDYVVGGFFPNPSNGNVNLWMSLSKDIDFSVEVHNALGQIVYREARDIDSGYNKLEFDFSRLAKGSYIAHVKLGTEVVTRKLVLQ